MQWISLFMQFVKICAIINIGDLALFFEDVTM